MAIESTFLASKASGIVSEMAQPDVHRNVAAIVPAHNEEKRLAKVLEVLTTSPTISEVICINDASTDSTRQVAESFSGVKLINLPINKGKANAVVEGIYAAKSEIILLIDADLSGLTEVILQELVSPMHTGKYDLVIGFPYGPEDVTLFRPLTGERAYLRKDLLPLLETLRHKRYGLELYLNYEFRQKRMKFVTLRGVRQLHKVGKYKFSTAMKREMATWKDILGEVSQQDQPGLFAYHSYLRNFYVPHPVKKAKRKTD